MMINMEDGQFHGRVVLVARLLMSVIVVSEVVQISCS